MKARPVKWKPEERTYVDCVPSIATHVRLHFPGPLPNRILPVMIGGTRRGTGNWTWNGSIDEPTLKPSILTQGEDEQGKHRCHSFVESGVIRFLDDCTHEFAGQSRELLEVD